MKYSEAPCGQWLLLLESAGVIPKGTIGFKPYEDYFHVIECYKPGLYLIANDFEVTTLGINQ